MEIRVLNASDLSEAVALKIKSWTEELVGKAENTLILETELAFWLNWMQSAEENQDVRLLLGAFDGRKLVGAAFGSFAEVEDIPVDGIELNGLWVYPEYRNRGLSLKMLSEMLAFYKDLGKTQMVVYNHHFSESNAYYHKLDGTLIRQVTQMKGKLLVDVFLFDVNRLKGQIDCSLQRY